MKRKMILAAASAMTIFTIAGCTNSSQDIATMKGGSITVDDYFNQVKSQSNTQQAVGNMIIYKAFNEKYGKDVTDKEVQEAYDEQKKQYEDQDQGTSFNDALKQSGYTEKTFKESLKNSLAFDAGIDAHVEVTDDDLKTAWESFHPEVEAQIIQVASEDEAKEIKKQLDAGDDFAKIAKEKSTDAATKEDGGKVSFDSQSTTIPTEVQTAAYKLKDGQVSDPIEAMSASTYQTAYYIVKMTKNKDKGNDMKPYKKELDEIAKQTKKNDQTFTSKVISEVLKDANVKIKDASFKDVLAGYLETEASSDSSDAKDTKSSSTSSSKKDEASNSSSEKETGSSSTDSSSTDSSSE